MCFCVATAYGKGVYFSSSFSYSAQPTYSVPDKDKNQHMFQCRVLTGHYHVGKPELVEPPVRDKKSLALYNSVVDNVKNPVIFVVFHDTQVYPEYLVVFRQWWRYRILSFELSVRFFLSQMSMYYWTWSWYDVVTLTVSSQTVFVFFFLQMLSLLVIIEVCVVFAMRCFAVGATCNDRYLSAYPSHLWSVSKRLNVWLDCFHHHYLGFLMPDIVANSHYHRRWNIKYTCGMKNSQLFINVCLYLANNEIYIVLCTIC